MLDQSLLEQLKTIFSPMKKSVEIIYDSSNHESATSLLEMLTEVASTSKFITLSNSNIESLLPKFKINNISFTGVPGGHEFSTLVLAILNASGEGKFPDDSLVNRIKNLKGPIKVRTFISLSCENCPDVVQAINLMSLIHPEFTHEIIDGAMMPEEIARHSIQGVPSILVQDKLLHSGRITLSELLTKFEQEFGTKGELQELDLGSYDVAIIGGGPAGVSAAIYSVRKGLKTAIIAEKVGGQVQETKGIENLISIPYTEGPQLSEQLLKHLNSYPVKIFEHRRVKEISRNKKIFLESKETIHANQIIVATGAKWRELGIKGEKEYLGKGVAFCPHCDGPYYKGKKIAVVGGGNSGVEAAIDLAGIAREVILFEFMENLKADKVLIDKLKSLPNVSIITNARTDEIIGNGAKVVALAYENRSTKEISRIDLDGVFVQIGLLPNSGFLRGHLELTKFGEIVVDEKGRTSVDGIYAAGDVTTIPYKQIIISMGDGAKVALAAFEDRMKIPTL